MQVNSNMITHSHNGSFHTWKHLQALLGISTEEMCSSQALHTNCMNLHEPSASTYVSLIFKVKYCWRFQTTSPFLTLFVHLTAGGIHSDPRFLQGFPTFPPLPYQIFHLDFFFKFENPSCVSNPVTVYLQKCLLALSPSLSLNFLKSGFLFFPCSSRSYQFSVQWFSGDKPCASWFFSFFFPSFIISSFFPFCSDPNN